MKEKVLYALSTVPPFSSFPADIQRDLEPKSQILSFDSKEEIFHEGEEARQGYAVLSGRVALLKASPSGKELIIELVVPQSPFGIIAFLGRQTYPLTARAQISTEVLTVPADDVIPLLSKFPEVQREITTIIADRFRASQEFTRALAHDRVEKRIASILLLCLRKIKIAEQCTTASVELAIPRQELADVAGITIETASRVVKQLERDGIVDASKYGSLFVLDEDRLASLLLENAPG